MSASQWLGPFELEAELGRGGMGVVYRARDTRTGQTVALKVLLDLATDLEGLERFRREATVLHGVVHPNLVRVLDLRLQPPRPYAVFEYVEGETLQQRVEREGPLPWRTAVRTLSEVAAGAAAAHERGLLHRDIKPANVLLGSSGAKLADFGLVKDFGQDSLTQSGSSLGTPSYMAPEQVGSEKDRWGAPTDVYGLAATLYFALTGQLPFSGLTTVTILNHVLKDPPPSPRAVTPTVPAWLDALCRRGMSKQGADRFPSAIAFRAALRDGGRGGTRRTPWGWVAAGIALALLVAGLGLASVWGDGGPDPALDPEPPSVLPVEAEDPLAQVTQALKNGVETEGQVTAFLAAVDGALEQLEGHVERERLASFLAGTVMLTTYGLAGDAEGFKVAGGERLHTLLSGDRLRLQGESVLAYAHFLSEAPAGQFDQTTLAGWVERGEVAIAGLQAGQRGPHLVSLARLRVLQEPPQANAVEPLLRRALNDRLGPVDRLDGAKVASEASLPALVAEFLDASTVDRLEGPNRKAADTLLGKAQVEEGLTTAVDAIKNGALEHASDLLERAGKQAQRELLKACDGDPALAGLLGEFRTRALEVSGPGDVSAALELRERVHEGLVGKPERSKEAVKRELADWMWHAVARSTHDPRRFAELELLRFHEALTSGEGAALPDSGVLGYVAVLSGTAPGLLPPESLVSWGNRAEEILAGGTQKATAFSQVAALRLLQAPADAASAEALLRRALELRSSEDSVLWVASVAASGGLQRLVLEVLGARDHGVGFSLGNTVTALRLQRKAYAALGRTPEWLGVVREALGKQPQLQALHVEEVGTLIGLQRWTAAERKLRWIRDSYPGSLRPRLEASLRGVPKAIADGRAADPGDPIALWRLPAELGEEVEALLDSQRYAEAAARVKARQPDADESWRDAAVAVERRLSSEARISAEPRLVLAEEVLQSMLAALKTPQEALVFEDRLRRALEVGVELLEPADHRAWAQRCYAIVVNDLAGKREVPEVFRATGAERLFRLLLEEEQELEPTLARRLVSLVAEDKHALFPPDSFQRLADLGDRARLPTEHPASAQCAVFLAQLRVAQVPPAPRAALLELRTCAQLERLRSHVRYRAARLAEEAREPHLVLSLLPFEAQDPPRNGWEWQARSQRADAFRALGWQEQRLLELRVLQTRDSGVPVMLREADALLALERWAEADLQIRTLRQRQLTPEERGDLETLSGVLAERAGLLPPFGIAKAIRTSILELRNRQGLDAAIARLRKDLERSDPSWESSVTSLLAELESELRVTDTPLMDRIRAEGALAGRVAIAAPAKRLALYRIMVGKASEGLASSLSDFDSRDQPFLRRRLYQLGIVVLTAVAPDPEAFRSAGAPGLYRELLAQRDPGLGVEQLWSLSRLVASDLEGRFPPGIRGELADRLEAALPDAQLPEAPGVLVSLARLRLKQEPPALGAAAQHLLAYSKLPANTSSPTVRMDAASLAASAELHELVLRLLESSGYGVDLPAEQRAAAYRLQREAHAELDSLESWLAVLDLIQAKDRSASPLLSRANALLDLGRWREARECADAIDRRFKGQPEAPLLGAMAGLRTRIAALEAREGPAPR